MSNIISTSIENIKNSRLKNFVAIRVCIIWLLVEITLTLENFNKAKKNLHELLPRENAYIPNFYHILIKVYELYIHLGEFSITS